MVVRVIQSAEIPVAKKAEAGLTRRDGKRPDGLTLISWQGGKPMTWDVTVVTTLTAQYLSSSARSAGAATDLAASRKEATRIFFSQSQWNPTLRFVQVPYLSSQLWSNAWLVPPGTCPRCHRLFVPKTLDHYTALQFGLNTRELCFRAPHRLNDIFTFYSCNDMLAMLPRGQ